MDKLRGVKITGTGMYVPPKVVTNQDLEKIMDTSDDWIRQRSGIEKRHHVEAPQSTSDLAWEASQNALRASNMQATDIDLIIVATLSPDHQFPGTSAILQQKLGLSTTPAMDIRCQCSGFLYALNTGKLFVASGQYNKVLVVGAEAHSPILDMTSNGREVSVLFGDGAGAVILEPSDNGSQIQHIALHTQGEYAEKLWIEKPGTAGGERWLTAQDVQEGLHFPLMEGRYVFKHAVTRLAEVINETLSMSNLSIADIDHFLFHQANLRINEKVSSMLSIPESKVHSNIMNYGNCSAASIPMLLDECVRQEKITRGQNVMMAAFGAGFTWAGAVVRW